MTATPHPVASGSADGLHLRPRKVEPIPPGDVPVMEAKTGAALVAWCRDFGLNRLLKALPEATQRAWERDLVREGEALRSDGVIRLGGVTRLVVAH